MIRNIGQSLVRGARMARADRGLFHGKDKMYGNNVSYSNRHTRRSWTPNIQTKTFDSDILDTKLRIKVSSKALKCIDRAGSLDNYVLFTKDKDINSKAGVALKKIMKEKWQAKHGTKFNARRINFELKIAHLLKAGKITEQDYQKLLASGGGEILLPKSMSPLHVEKLVNPKLNPTQEATAVEDAAKPAEEQPPAAAAPATATA